MRKSKDSIKVSDFVINFLSKKGVKDVFMLSGGGAMHLIDSLGRHPKMNYICNHHEQASSMAAEAYWRISGIPGVALVTTGPAGTNAITGVMCSWTDSIPMFVLSGQAKSTALIADTGLRQLGVHEADITKLVDSITKYAVTVMDPSEIEYHLEKAFFLCKSGRPGPVWIDVPLDIQGVIIDPKKNKKFNPVLEFPDISPKPSSGQISQLKKWILESKRPVFLVGYGIKLASLEEDFRVFIEKMNIPVALTKNAFDFIEDAHPLLAGQVGTYGQRSGNFAIQNSDLLICLGTRLSSPVTGYEADLFARQARVVVVDIDKAELEHSLIKIDLPIYSDLPNFFNEFNSQTEGTTWSVYKEWRKKVSHWREVFPNVTDFMRNRTDYVDPYYFYEVLSENIDASTSLVWDQGATFYCSTVAFKVKKGQKAFSNGGFTPMGYGLPAAIGACYANNLATTICVNGDGGLQLNVQELQTIRHNNLPIKIFIFNNEGYLSIKQTQQAYFDGFLVGSDPSSGVSCPDTIKLSEGYGIPSRRIHNASNIKNDIIEIMKTPGPMVIDLMIDPFQIIEPRVASKQLSDGSMRSNPLEDMSPLLDRDLLEKEMIIPLVSNEE